jgi:hypothetical protein
MGGEAHTTEGRGEGGEERGRSPKEGARVAATICVIVAELHELGERHSNKGLQEM